VQQLPVAQSIAIGVGIRASSFMAMGTPQRFGGPIVRGVPTVITWSTLSGRRTAATFAS